MLTFVYCVGRIRLTDRNRVLSLTELFSFKGGNNMKKMCKSLLSLMLVLIVVLGVVSPVAPIASALSYSNFYTDSDIWLVDCNTHKTASTINLYGRADYFCLKLKQTDSYKDIFYFRLYSDSKKNKEVLSYSTEYSEKGTKYITLPVSFDDLKSGTYYAETYVYKRCVHGPTGVQLPDSYVPREVDEDTRRTYKIIIQKKGTSIDEMNTVMYGYENTENGPRIYWYSVPGATGYYVYRKSPKTGKYSKIKTVKDSGDKFTGYTDSTYKGENVTRYYKVVAYKGSLKTPSSLKSMKVKAYKTPTVKVETISDNRIKISWSKVSSDAKYTVYSRHNDSDSWKEVKTTGNRSYVLDAREYESNETYRFTVVAKVNGISSGYNTKGVALRYLEYPELKACTYPDDGGITVNWKSVSGADSYTVYRKKSQKSDWKELDTVKGGSTTEYTDLTANNEEYYYYSVRSVRKGVNGSMDKAGVPATILTSPVLSGFSELDGQSVRISWEKLPNKCEYVVLRKTTAGWEEIATTSNNYYDYNFNSLIAEETFTVRAERGKFASDFDPSGISYSSYPDVVITNVVATAENVTLTWKKPKNAGNSVVYKQVEDGEFVEIANTNETTFVDDFVDYGIKYTYKVAYYYNENVIEEATAEITLKLNSDVVEKEDEVYNTSLSYGTKSFTTKIKDYDKFSEYRIYRETENGWIRMTSSITEQGEITVKSNDFGKVESFAIVKITPDGDYRVITEPDFTVEFNSDYIPGTLVSASVENSYPTITWDFDSTKTADNIHVYRKVPESKNVYKLVGVVSAAQNFFVDESAKPNYVYDYQLRVEKDGFVTYGGPVVQVNYMGAPVFEIHNYKGGTWLRWSQPSRAEKYVVYKKLSSETEWTEIATTTNLYYDDKNDKKYVGVMYMVVAIDGNGNQSLAGYSGEWIYVPSVAEFEVKNESKNNKLTWKAVDGADGYLIVYEDYNIAKKKWSEEKTIKVSGGSKSSYTDKSVPANVLRRYRLHATYKGFEGVYSIDGGGYISTQPEITSIKSTNNGVKMKFSKISGVSEYVVYRKAPGDTKWKKLKTVSSRTYTDSSAKEGKKYSYTVKARFDKCGCPIYSTYNSKGWSITYNP